MISCSLCSVFFFFKGNENHWTQASGEKSLWPRKCGNSWKTQVGVKFYLIRQGHTPSKIMTTLTYELCCLSAIGFKCGQVIQPASSAQMGACTCVWTFITKSCEMILCWMSCELSCKFAWQCTFPEALHIFNGDIFMVLKHYHNNTFWWWNFSSSNL